MKQETQQKQSKHPKWPQLKRAAILWVINDLERMLNTKHNRQNGSKIQSLSRADNT